MESGEAVVSATEKPLNGTALAGAELEAVLVFAGGLVPSVAVLEPIPVFRALSGGVKIPEEGVYLTEDVRAFDPADAAPEEENVFAAPGPLVPAELLA
jgi:hypothetical protein